MAINKYPWRIRGVDDTDWWMVEGRGPTLADRFFTIRMKFEGDECIQFVSVTPEIHVPIELIDQKLALLKAAPVGAKVSSVGWRRTENIFYLHIYENDLPLGGYK